MPGGPMGSALIELLAPGRDVKFGHVLVQAKAPWNRIATMSCRD